MAFLESLSIKHYKGFFEEQSIDFASPNGKTEGSGLNVIVGPNNSGKTTVIEALLIDNTNNKKFTNSERHSGFDPQITIKGDELVIYTNIDGGSQVMKTNESKNHNITFDIIQSRRYWSYRTTAIRDEDFFSQQSNKQPMRNSSGIDTAALLKTINKDSSKKRMFDELLRQITPQITNWTIDTDDDNNDYINYMTGSGVSHQAGLLGDGIISIFRICAQLLNGNEKVLIIDEPELSLHPGAQKNLSLLLSKLSKDKQIIICTHSPYFVNWNDFIGGSKFTRLNKFNDQKCTTGALDNTKNYGIFIENNIDEWQRPQLLDLTSKEIMFGEKILFVEGQEDVGLIKKYCNEQDIQLDFDIFGYGVGGYSNMKLFLELSKDLGLIKVAALYDSGPDTDTEYTTIQTEYTNYCFQKLSTTDIRDKYTEGCDGSVEQIKEGMFDQSGNMKSEKEEEFKSIIDALNTYFNS